MSDENKSPEMWGTIFTQHGEHTLDGMEHSRSTAWTEQDESAYLERVRQKAKDMAAGIIADANTEAETIRKQAHEQGYSKGIADSSKELDAFRSDMAESIAAVLNAIEGQCSAIFDQWRGDILGIAKLAVERITAIELEDKRREILEALLVEAIGLLEKRRELVIRANPEDESMLNDIVGMTQERFSDVRSWRVKADPGISPGGMVVESESSLAEGRVESRMAAVDQILSQLVLPEHPEQENTAS